MGSNQGGLVVCPSCGNIQEGPGQCRKCGTAVVDRPFVEGRTTEQEPVREADTTEVPPGASANARGLRLSPSDTGSGSGSTGGQPGGQKTRSETQSQPKAREPILNVMVPIHMPPGRLFAFSLFTFGFYQFLWFYRNWKIIEIYRDGRVRPLKLTLMLFIPVYGIYLVYRQLNDLNEMVKPGTEGFPVVGLLVGWTALGAWLLVAARIDAGFLLTIPYMASVFFLMPVQLSLNSYSRALYPSQTPDEPHFGWNCGAVTVVALFLAVGITDIVVRHINMEAFKRESTELAAIKASTTDETRALLKRYTAYIEASKGFMNARNWRKREKVFFLMETMDSLDKMQEQFHCINQGELRQLKLSMIDFLVKDNKFISKEGDGMHAVVRLRSLPTLYRNDAQSVIDEACASGPFDLNAFAREMAPSQPEHRRMEAALNRLPPEVRERIGERGKKLDYRHRLPPGSRERPVGEGRGID